MLASFPKPKGSFTSSTVRVKLWGLPQLFTGAEQLTAVEEARDKRAQRGEEGLFGSILPLCLLAPLSQRRGRGHVFLCR